MSAGTECYKKQKQKMYGWANELSDKLLVT